MSTNPHAHIGRPGRPSPWRGSEYVTLHGWELDDVNSLLDAASKIRAVAAELEAAHDAGWWLESPMLDGRLHARRPSRRQRTRARRVDVADRRTPPEIRVRVRIVDEPEHPERHALTFDTATATPWLAARAGEIGHVAGPPDENRLRIVTSQVTPEELGNRRWAIVAARVGPGVDLVAEGTALRAHAVIDGVVVRTLESLGYKHAADRATTLHDAAAAYRRLADAAVAMNHAGGKLSSVDEGFLVVEYPHDAG